MRSLLASAQKALKTIVDPARLMRAGLKGREERRQEVWDGVYQLRPTNDHLRERVQKLRGSLVTRLRTLAIASSTFLHAHPSPSTPSTPRARRSPSPPRLRRATLRLSSLSGPSWTHGVRWQRSVRDVDIDKRGGPDCEELQAQMVMLSEAISCARSGLVEVFSVKKQLGHRSLGIGALPGSRSESPLALLPQSRYDSDAITTPAQVALGPSEEGERAATSRAWAG
ncbi:hypothetical protein C8Q76DRAFT_697543 [Earliella scabrosa]|nr:hypothetical protein C8Q76DRAFT_697543 [Earliella scabrosa]